jgi:uncharacterized membrane protein
VKPRTRLIVQAILYEAGAIAATSPALALMFNEPASSTITLAVIISTIALLWNYIFNHWFERWETRQAIKGRSFQRRLLHGIGFEGGLVFMLVPLLAYWLDTSLLNAFIAELGILLFFLVYAIAYTWAFDKVFGLPVSATPVNKPDPE